MTTSSFSATSEAKHDGRLARYLPILEWGKHYSRELFVSDLLAGLIVAIMLVPQSMAYALLAEVPPVLGIYAAVFPVLIYSIFGPSKHISIG